MLKDNYAEMRHAERIRLKPYPGEIKFSWGAGMTSYFTGAHPIDKQIQTKQTLDNK